MSETETGIPDRSENGPEAQSCTHHWIIARAEDKTSAGECQKCHLKREFKNSIYSDTSSNWTDASRARKRALEESAPLVKDLTEEPEPQEDKPDED